MLYKCWHIEHSRPIYFSPIYFACNFRRNRYVNIPKHLWSFKRLGQYRGLDRASKYVFTVICKQSDGNPKKTRSVNGRSCEN